MVHAATTRGALVELADAADRAAHDGQALAVLDVDLAISPVALLDLFDHAGRRTAALVRDGAPGDDALRPRTSAGRRCASARGARRWWSPSARQTTRCAAANAVALGAVRVDAADVPAAARLWRQAASREWAGSPSALALSR